MAPSFYLDVLGKCLLNEHDFLGLLNEHIPLLKKVECRRTGWDGSEMCEGDQQLCQLRVWNS